MSTQSFADLGVSRAVVSSLSQQGITQPFAIQRDVIGDVLAGRDVLAKSPTGSGKTLAFGIPLVDRIGAEAAPAGRAGARAHARAGHADRRRHPRHRPRSRAAGDGGLRRRRPGQAGHATPPRSHVLVATPGRLEDLLARRRVQRSTRSGSSSSTRPTGCSTWASAPRSTGSSPPVRRARQTLFFSATLDGEAGRIARRYTRDPAVHEHGPAARRASADVEHRFVDVAHEHRVDALVAELRRDRELTLVFVRTKHGADRLVKRLRAHGVEAVAMHGNKSQRQREQALARFESGAVDTLVATDVAARGIDVARNLARDQLRSARRQRDLRPPDRAHRPRRRQGHRHHARRRRPSGATSPSSPRNSGSRCLAPRSLLTRPQPTGPQLRQPLLTRPLLRNRGHDRDRLRGGRQIPGLKARLGAPMHLVEGRKERVGGREEPDPRSPVVHRHDPARA